MRWYRILRRTPSFRDGPQDQTRNDEVWIGSVAALLANMRSRSRDAKRPSRALNLRPSEGVGNAGCPLHPQPRVHFVLVERTRVTTSTPESPGIPARNGFNGLLRALPGDRALLPPSFAD
jgi:hypothetical protein